MSVQYSYAFPLVLYDNNQQRHTHTETLHLLVNAYKYKINKTD